MFDKLPISAFVSEPKTPEPDLDLSKSSILELHGLWNYQHLQAICWFYGLGGQNKTFWNDRGQYECTLDNYHSDPDVIDYSTSEVPEEHKSFNLIELDNGQFALYPNNRCRIYDNSLTPETPKIPDFKVSTEFFQVENGVDWGRLGHTDEYFWETETERDNDPESHEKTKEKETK